MVENSKKIVVNFELFGCRCRILKCFVGCDLQFCQITTFCIDRRSWIRIQETGFHCHQKCVSARHERYLSRYIVTLPYRPFFGISLYICCIQGIIFQQYCIYVALKLLIFNSVVYMLNSGQSYLIELYICCIQASNIGQCCIYVTFMSVILDSVVYMLHSCQSSDIQHFGVRFG